jgi:glutathione S-transferase
VFKLYNVDYEPVEQVGGRDNPELVDWTKHRNAPIAMYENEPPRVRWQEILDLAERLGTGPSLYPTDIEDRLTMVGLSSEICGENGFGWNARTIMQNVTYQAHGDKVFAKNPMFNDYQFSEEAATDAETWVKNFLSYLSDRINTQREKGSMYLVGDKLTAADVFWACFSNMLQALPHEVNPMPDGLRNGWSALAANIKTYDPILIEQRDEIYKKHLWLPLTF